MQYTSLVAFVRLRAAVARFALTLTCGLCVTGCFPSEGRFSEAANMPVIKTINNPVTPGFDISPDGDSIVFSAKGQGGLDLFLLDIATKQVTRVTNTPLREDVPAFSPDGGTIVFAAQETQGEPAHLFICRPNGSARTQVTRDNLCDFYPAFSPDGKQLVFTRALTRRPYSMGGYIWDDWDLFVVQANGTSLRQITGERYYALYTPQTVPDGTKVIFAATRPTANSRLLVDIYMASVQNSTVPQPLTNDGHSSEPSLSRDGKQIVFISDRVQPFAYEVYTMTSEGVNPVQLTRGGADNIRPRFAPDGRSVLFLSDTGVREGRFDLMQVDTDGTNLRRIADNGLFDDPLGWKANASRQQAK